MKTVLELEKSIGFGGKVRQSLYYHPNNKEFAYVAGACIVVGDLSDSHKQEFLRGHDDSITCLKISKKGTFIISGQVGHNADVCVWDFKKRKIIHRFSEHDYGISSVDVTPDERILVSAGIYDDNKIIFWDIKTGCVISHTSIDPHYKRSNRHTEASQKRSSVVVSGDHCRDIKRRQTKNYQFAFTSDKRLYYVELNPFKGKCTRTEMVTKKSVVREYTCVRFNDFGDLVFAGSSTGDVLLFSVKGKVLVKYISVCSYGVQSILINKDSLQLFAGGGDGTITEIEVDSYTYKLTSRRKLQLKKYSAVNSLNWDESKEKIFCGCGYGEIYELPEKSFKPKLFFDTHHDAVTDVIFPPKINDKFVTVSDDQSVRFWDLSDYSVIFSADYSGNELGRPTGVTFVADIMFSCWTDGSIRAIDSISGEKLFSKDNAHRESATNIVSGSNRRFMITSGKEGEIKIWSVKGFKMVSQLKKHTSVVSDLLLFQDDVHFLSSSHDRSVYCWDLTKEKIVTGFVNKAFPIESVSLHKDQMQFLSVGKKIINYWDIRERKPVKILRYSDSDSVEAKTVCFSGDGDYFAVSGTDEVIHLYDFRMAKVVSEGMGHSGSVNCVRFSPDDKQMISVGDDEQVFVWNKFSFEEE